MNYFIVEENFVDERLDKFLTFKTTESRSQIKKAIENGLILVNDKPAKVHQFLKFKDKVTIIEKNPKQKLRPKTNSKSQLTKLKNTIFNKKEKLPTDLIPKILHKEKNFIIIEKPCNLLVHSTRTSTEPTLVDWLIKKFPQIEKIADAKSLLKKDLTFRPGIVHRLDKDVSGVMLIALNQEAYEYFKIQFQQRKVTKKYIAIVHGRFSKNEGEIDFEIARSAKGNKMAAHPAGSGKGKKALTKFDIVERYNKATKVEVQLMTGRTNQIRVHFFALGHPIIGDIVYHLKEKTKLRSSRILLHAKELSFTDQAGKVQTFISQEPKEFNF